MKNINVSKRAENWLSAGLLVIVTVLTYSPLISQLGFYRDDWYLIWTAQARGVDGILSLFKGDRPFLGWLYVFDYKLLGASPLNWHLYALLIKVLGALAFLWLLRSLWPHKKIETTFIALLFVIYPGFYQQPNAATFKNLLLAYAGAMLSLAFTIQALRSRLVAKKVSFMILAVLLAAFYIFIYEALIGIEAIRLLLIWYYLRQSNEFRSWKELLRRTFLESIPYLLFSAGFLFWRIFLFESTRRSTNVDVVISQYGSSPLHIIARLAIETFKDLVETTFLAWSVPYYQFMVAASEYRTIAFAFAIVTVVLVAVYLYYLVATRQVEPSSHSDQILQTEKDWIVLGAITVVVTTLPIVLAGRNVIFGIQWDRYTYQSILGVALLMGGLVFYAVRGRLRWMFLGALLMTGIVTQFFSADFYRTFWTLERESMWQLSWRAPQIEDGTTLVLVLPTGYGLAEEYEVWGPANLVYRPGQENVQLPGQVMFDGIAVEMERGTQEERTVRGTVKIVRDYGKVIVLSQPSVRSCLHVLDGQRADQVFTDGSNVRAVAKYSDVELIDTTGVQIIPPVVIFGSEPEHDWCYFYQKMDLARQEMDWQQAATLADDAISSGLSPADVSEWLPAMEAYLHTNNEKKAKQLVRLIRVDKDVFHGLCEQMNDSQEDPAGYDRELLFSTLCVR